MPTHQRIRTATNRGIWNHHASELSRIVVSLQLAAQLGSRWDSLRSLVPALRCYTSSPAEDFGGFFHSV